MNNNNFQIGDKVSVLDDTFDGEVIGVDKNNIIVKTTDGFTMTYLVNELVKINNVKDLDRVFLTKSLSDVLHEKAEEKKRSFIKEKKSKKEDFVLEVDLHIDKLVKSYSRLSNYEMLNIQMESAKGQLEFAIKKRMPKLVFIHGVGEGVLKSELEFMLSRYDGISFKEADYRKYGIGATEVYIKQNYNR